MRTYKHLRISLVVLVSVLLLPYASHSATLGLSPATGSFNVGDILTVNILLSTEGAAADGADIRYLNYDPNLLEVIDEDPGTVGIQILYGSLMPNIVSPTVDTVNGRIGFSQVTDGGTTFTNSSPQILATVRFRVLTPGTAAVAFNAVSGTPTDTNVGVDGLDVLTSVTNGSYTLNSIKFELNDRVQVSSGPLNVRDCASTSCSSLGTQSTGAQGTVIGGPTAADGYAWWQIDYDAAPDGWSVEDFLEEAVPDTEAPSVPTGLSATAVSSSQIDLGWDASTDNVGVTGYRVYRDGTHVGSPTGTTYSDTGLTPSSAHSYTVAAVDAAGNLSAQSAPVNAITTAGTAGLAAGDRVSTTANLNVRSSGTINASILGTQPVGVQGTLVSGPTTANGYTWWNINYDQGTDGWSVDAYLAELYPTLPTVGFNTETPNQSLIDRLVAQIANLQTQVANLLSQMAAVGAVGQ